MKDEVSNEYISQAVDELVAVFGVREPVPRALFLSRASKRKNIKTVISSIAECFDLPIRIDLSFISKEYDKSATPAFDSRHVTKSDGTGTHGIVAQVLIPSALPFYRDRALKDFPISIKLPEDFGGVSAAFVTVMAHDLSHVVLYALRHQKKENEFYTDLTAMIFGFMNIMTIGRKISITQSKRHIGYTQYTTTTTRYGYLSDNNFEYAKRKITQLLHDKATRVHAVKKTAEEIGKEINSAKALIAKMQKNLALLDKHPHKKISAADTQRILLLHSPSYFSENEAFFERSRQNLGNMERRIEQARTTEVIKALDGEVATLRRTIGVAVRL